MILPNIPEDWKQAITANKECWPIFIDWLEEQGDYDRVEGYRAILRHNVLPNLWVSPTGHCCWHGEETITGCQLSDQWVDQLTQKGNWCWHYKCLFDALDDAALAYSQMSKK